ncbi:Peroxiredoxin-2 [Cucumispora dikerogammari]|nr:Peroxiredoxin-2 [Cucumispora dikerogammari]
MTSKKQNPQNENDQSQQNEKQNNFNSIGTSQLNTQLPPISLKAVIDEKIQNININDLRGNYTVLIFYPFDFTFVCPSEILKFSSYKPEFDKINCKILFISSDSEYSHLAWSLLPVSENGIKGVKYPLVSDYKHELINFLNIRNKGNHTERATCILDGELRVRQITINDPRVGRSVKETLRLVSALQFIDKNDDKFCMVDWEMKDEE